MLANLLPVAQDCQIELPEAHKRRVGIVGAGVIVDVAHLPAYRQLGLEVAAIADLDTDKASGLAARHEIGRIHASAEALIADDAVEVVDIAVTPWAQPEIARAALAAGKPVLCQKPLALDLAEAEALGREAGTRGVALAVNQQLRFEEGFAAARSMVRRGWIGEPLQVSFHVDITTDFSAWDWFAKRDRMEITYHSIHYFDAIRSVLGEPELVFATGSRAPGQYPVGETRTIATLVYPGEVRALVHSHHENRAGDIEAAFRITGSEGAIRGTLGLLNNYPDGGPDTLEVFSRTLPTDGWLAYPVTQRWIPDAFRGPIASLLNAAATGGQPETSAEDNLGTLRLVDALYRSMETGESQRLR